MIINDERTEAEKKKYPVIIAGTYEPPKWRAAIKARLVGPYYVGWACRKEDMRYVENWVRRQYGIRQIRIVCSRWRPKGAGGHTHIHVCREGHPALIGNKKDNQVRVINSPGSIA